MQKKTAKRYLSLILSMMVLLLTVFAWNTGTASAATKWKISPSSKTITAGKSVKIKSNKKVKWSVKKGKSVVKITKKTSKTATVKGLKAGKGYIKVRAGKKTKTIKITVKAKPKKPAPKPAKGSVIKGSTKSGLMTLKIDLSKGTYDQNNKVARVWVPIPTSDEYQTVNGFGYEANDATTAKITTDSAGNKILYLEWNDSISPEKRTAKVHYHVTRYQIASTKMVENGSVDKNAMKKYLSETETSGSLTSGVVKETADRIVKDANAKTVLEKAKAIYEWEIHNLYRREITAGDLSFSGCGRGEVEMVLTQTKGGKCTDLNSTYVALCRSVGVPAREKFGLRMNNGSSGNANGNEHCRCEFYLPGTGWVEVDPGDTLKAMLKEDGIEYGGTKKASDLSTERMNELRSRYWGANDNNWIKLASGRDITLEPAQKGHCTTNNDWERCLLNKSGTLNNMGYVYGETNDQYMQTYNPSSFGYTYKFYEDK